MIPKQAIEKAIEGGYQDFPFILMKPPYDRVYVEGNKIVAEKSEGGWDSSADAFFKDLNYYKIALDSTFWQALGKALGWKEPVADGVQTYWSYQAVRFCGLILTGSDTEQFWEELLTNPN